MQTVVLVAGEGTRMRPLTATRPKPLLPVADRPLVAHTMDAAAEAGASRFVLVVGHEGEQIREQFGDTYRGVPVAYATQERAEGTADAVRAAADHLDREPFVVVNGDDLYDSHAVAAMYAHDGATGADETGSGDGGGVTPAVGAYRVSDPENYGVLHVEGDRVTGVTEKPADPDSDLVNVGLYRFPGAALDALDVPRSERGEYELTDVLAHVCAAFTVRPVSVDRWQGVGRPWELLAANEWKLETLEPTVAEHATVADDATLRGSVVVEPGARIEPGVVIEGPALVGAGAHVGPNAYVRGAALVGEDARVGHAVEVKNSVLLPEASVGHLSYVGDSVIGARVNFGAGTTVANLRHDDRSVRMTVNGESVDTGRRKFGVVAGDDAKTGINTSLNPGVRLGAGATTLPGETVTEDRGDF